MQSANCLRIVRKTWTRPLTLGRWREYRCITAALFIHTHSGWGVNLLAIAKSKQKDQPLKDLIQPSYLVWTAQRRSSQSTTTNKRRSHPWKILEKRINHKRKSKNKHCRLRARVLPKDINTSLQHLSSQGRKAIFHKKKVRWVCYIIQANTPSLSRIHLVSLPLKEHLVI